MKLHPAIAPISCLLAIAVISGSGIAAYHHYKEEAVIADVKSRFYKEFGGNNSPSAYAIQQMKIREAEIRIEAEINRAARRALR